MNMHAHIDLIMSMLSVVQMLLFMLVLLSLLYDEGDGAVFLFSFVCMY